MKAKTIGIIVLFLFFSLSSIANAGWKDTLNGLIKNNSHKNTTAQSTGKGKITNSEKNSALKQALQFGVKNAVSNLSKTNGFLDNPYVKIPVPKSLKTVAKVLKSVGQEKLVNNFVAEMNHAAEKATPKTVNIFMGAIKKMTIKDAAKILTGPDNAATQYFRKNTYSSLFKAIKPIIKESTSKTNVTKYYKDMMGTYKKYESPVNKISSFKSMLSGNKAKKQKSPSSDLDTYITNKTIDGIFYMIAQEEKKIRQNPMARTTTLLKKVFGSL